jgi:ribosomal protein S18 acetylase RimI-like enzyme
MRPGRREDLPQLLELWRGEVARGRQDAVPGEDRMRRLLERFDWESSSRVIEENGRLRGSVLVTIRRSPEGPLANLYAAGEAGTYAEMVRWGVLYARAASAAIVQVFAGAGHADGLESAGLRNVRPWWRMDRTLAGELPEVRAPEGYRLVDGASVPPGDWIELFNATFADHWRFAPRGEEEILGGKAPHLCVMATTGDGPGVALALADLERYEDDPRPQPVGLISSVGTMPAHRRRGLARWLVAELMRRLRHAGAASASLYVDGINPTRAPDLYRNLGFEVTFTAEVWEATRR